MAPFVERFGKVKSIDVNTAAATGRDFLRVAIDAGKFTAHVSVFKDEMVALLRDAAVGERIWVKGHIETNTVGDRSYKNIVVQFARLGEKPAEQAPEEAAIIDQKAFVAAEQPTAIYDIEISAPETSFVVEVKKTRAAKRRAQKTLDVVDAEIVDEIESACA